MRARLTADDVAGELRLQHDAQLGGAPVAAFPVTRLAAAAAVGIAAGRAHLLPAVGLLPGISAAIPVPCGDVAAVAVPTCERKEGSLCKKSTL